jgi:hypothetical protein
MEEAMARSSSILRHVVIYLNSGPGRAFGEPPENTAKYLHPFGGTMRLAGEKMGAFIEKGREKVELCENRPRVTDTIHDN